VLAGASPVGPNRRPPPHGSPLRRTPHDRSQAFFGTRATISIVQLPCCNFVHDATTDHTTSPGPPPRTLPALSPVVASQVHHATALGAPPDADYLDARIATCARAVRVWRDVSPGFDFDASRRRRGVPKCFATPRANGPAGNRVRESWKQTASLKPSHQR
jgi:hypothetical protein